MPQSPASRRYARALFELAQEQGRLDKVQADLAELVPLVEHKADYAALLEQHELSTGQRKDLWTAVLQGRADPLTLRFLHFLVEKRRWPCWARSPGLSKSCSTRPRASRRSRWWRHRAR